MKPMITDVHTHSTFSMDGREELSVILQTALQMGVAFYGVAEHFNYDLGDGNLPKYAIDAEQYFHSARHLQEDYAGAMNVLVGAEFGFTPDTAQQKRYAKTYAKYQPDFVVNSVHAIAGEDYYNKTPYYTADGKTIDKGEVYRAYFQLVKESLNASYPYDIVGHFGYCSRYAPYLDPQITLREFGDEIDGVLRAIIQKDKILEVNSSTKDGSLCVPSVEIIQRYYALGGRKVSFASDTHDRTRIAEKRAQVAEMLKGIGFTHITVPCKGEHIQVEL